ncbi:hypothetical protein QPK31_04770 [Massilia sp. YIM B02769]|uniref:hypothetical protein n=1 Tax=Massilia sp. YIM B02769 TaxID=3050129 RepID=UPI0025B70736|nr:hypothetical protein [Massilia sp. YIM B02769]MDN4057535.1 hypothetical protein [Massilia sp. YIM B02769]
MKLELRAVMKYYKFATSSAFYRPFAKGTRMNRMKQLAVIALVFGAAQAACAHESGAGTQAAPAASAQTAAQVPAGATSRELVVDVKRTSQLVKSAGGSAQINTDAYSTTTEYIYVTTIFAYNLAGELVDMKSSEIRTPRN